MDAHLWTNSPALLSPSQAVFKARTITEAGAGLRAALSIGREIRTIRLLFDPIGGDAGPWLDSVKTSTPEIRGILVQAFFVKIFRMAGYDVTVGKELDIFARNRMRSLFVEVKSSLNGIMLGSQKEITQLEGYLVASERKRAEIWLGTMGLNKPIRLRSRFRTEMRMKNIGLIDIRWVSPRDTLAPYLNQ